MSGVFQFNQNTLNVAAALHPPVSNVEQITTLLAASPDAAPASLSTDVHHLIVGDGNRLSSFVGVSAFDGLVSFQARQNVFRSLDDRCCVSAIAKLPALRVLDLSDNNISHVSLPNTAAARASDSAEASSVAGLVNNSSSSSSSIPHEWQNLSRLVLSGNVLCEVPNLRRMTSLRDLILDNNQLTTLTGIEFTLPSTLETLVFDNNQIAEWSCLIELASFADTMHEFSVAGNPVMQAARELPDAAGGAFELRYLLTLLLPGLHTLNGAPISADEQQLVTAAWSHMSDSALLAPGNATNLARFLHKQFPPGVNFSQPQQAAAAAADASTASGAVAAASCATAGNINLAEIDGRMSKTEHRTNKLVEVVKSLRHGDLFHRIRAARKVQRAFRGFAVRNRLSKQYSNFREWRIKMLAAQQQARSKNIVDALFPFGVHAAGGGGGGASSAAVAASSSSGELEKRSTQLAQMQGAMKTMFNDMEHMRGFLRAQRSAAARVIQKHWRGYLARKRFTRVKGEFHRFAAKFRPAVVKIQATFRMFAQRRRFLVVRAKERRVTSLEGEVASLKQQVADLCKAFSLIQRPSASVSPAASPARASAVQAAIAAAAAQSGGGSSSASSAASDLSLQRWKSASGSRQSSVHSNAARATSANGSGAAAASGGRSATRSNSASRGSSSVGAAARLVDDDLLAEADAKLAAATKLFGENVDPSPSGDSAAKSKSPSYVGVTIPPAGSASRHHASSMPREQVDLNDDNHDHDHHGVVEEDASPSPLGMRVMRNL